MPLPKQPTKRGDLLSDYGPEVTDVPAAPKKAVATKKKTLKSQTSEGVTTATTILTSAGANTAEPAEIIEAATTKKRPRRLKEQRVKRLQRKLTPRLPNLSARERLSQVKRPLTYLLKRLIKPLWKCRQLQTKLSRIKKTPRQHSVVVAPLRQATSANYSCLIPMS